MKQSEKMFSKLMEQYLDDLSNFGDDKEILLCENFFKRTKTLLKESKQNVNSFKLLTESALTKNEKELAEDFKLYVKQVIESNETN